MPKNQSVEGCPAVSAIPRKSLIIQTAEALIKHIAEGTWSGNLPSERRLCEILAVSRPTLRSAFNILEADGVISPPLGRLRKIYGKQSMLSTKAASVLEIAILCPIPVSEMLPPALFLMDQLHRRFQEIGYKLTIHCPGWLNYKNPERYMAQYVKETPAACWGLFSVSHAVQRWFSENGFPAVVSGSCYPSVNLPSLDFDNRAVAMHAVGRFLHHGHRKITLIQPEQIRPGDETIYSGFTAAINHARYPDAKGHILRASSQRHIFEEQLALHLKKVGTPVALLIPKALDALVITCFLLQRQIAIKTEVALICLNDDFYLDYVSPKLARYRIGKGMFASKLFQLFLKQAHSKALTCKPVLLTPSFEPGDTL